MAVRILWSLGEAAIMLDSLVKCLEGEVTRKEAIASVSKELRDLAKKDGKEIDDTFRNINGITLQMSSMENILTEGKRGLAKSVKVFREVVDLYKNDNTAFQQLLKETRQLQKSNTVQDRFFEWLEKQVSHATLADMFLVVGDIERFCIERNILKKKLFETTDLQTIRQVHNTVTSNKIFRRLYKKNLSKMESLILQYHRFIRAEEKSKRKEMSDDIRVTKIPEEVNNGVELVNKHMESNEVIIEQDNKTNQHITRDDFNSWMMSLGMSASTSRCYVSALNSFSVFLSNKAGKKVSVYEESKDRLMELRELLSTDQEMKNLNVQFHSQISAAITKLLQCRTGEAIQTSSVRSTRKDTSSINEPIPQISLPDFSGLGNDTNRNPEMEKLEKILNDKFTEGLLPNALRLDKFRMYYEEEYGCEATTDDQFLIEQLKCIGTFMDDRIYPRQDASQNNVIEEILTETICTLNAGARCIYLECVLERWRDELSKQLNVYNEQSLKDLLISQKVSGLIINDTVLKATTRKIYPEENVISVMKENHSFMNYEQLKAKIWFIPIEVIKHTLVTTPEIVNVDAETYFYAYNFPASAEELQQIKKYMYEKLETKGYLVAPDIYSIIHNKCCTVAINTDGYKDWAYRNIFKYLFRDDFEFGSSVISKKGNTIEMWQVYRGYCLEHERITLDDLKQLKDELGVTIYWDTVREEMIRINATELVRKDLINFDIDAIDAVLDEMCPNDYMPLKDISLFLHFPSIEYPWNDFVLESYLNISKKFCLYHASYANHGAFGVMVRRDSNFSDYKSVVVDMLAKSDEWKTAQEALTLVVKKGYQARKKWVGFEKITQEAGLMREKLLEEGK